MFRLTSIFLLIILSLSTPSLFAQSSSGLGALQIQISDSQSIRPISGVRIDVIAADQLTIEVSSDSQGKGQAKNLNPGRYEVRFSHPEYQTLIEPNVKIFENRTSRLNVVMLEGASVLDEIVVHSDKARVDDTSSVGSRYLDRESLRSAAGSGSDVLRALDGLPGLFSSGEFASYTVRGRGPDNNLIFVDGFPYANIVHFDNGFFELEELDGGGRYSVFAPNLIDSAKFQPGGWGSAYGGGTGSLLQLDVAMGNLDKRSYTARFDLAGVELGYSGPSGMHDNTSILLSARTQDFGRLFELIGQEDAGSPKNTDIIFKSSSELTNVDNLDFLLIYAPESTVRTVDNVLASDEDIPGVYQDIELVQNDGENILTGATWTRLVGDTGTWTNKLYYRYFEEISSSGEAFPDLVPIGTPTNLIPARANIISASRKETEIGLRSDFTNWNRLGRYSIGARLSQTDLDFNRVLDDDWIRYEYEQDDFRDNPNQRFVVFRPESFNSSLQESLRVYSLYAEQTMDRGDWQYRSGARFTHDDLSSDSQLLPRFSAIWRPSDRLKWTFTGGRYAQAPTFTQRASDPENKTLEHEITDQFSIGMSYLINPNLEVLVEPYYQNLTNLIVEADAIDQRLANTGVGRSYGIDLALIKRFSDGWSANFNYSYNKSEIKDEAGGLYYDSDFHRPHSVGVGGVWEINDRWKLSARWKYASGTPRDSYAIYQDVLGEGQPLRFSREVISNNNSRFENYHSLNFRVDYRRSFKRVAMTAFLDVINAYGSANPTAIDFNYSTGEETINDGEFIPILGVRFDW